MSDPASIESAVMAELQRQVDDAGMYAPWVEKVHSLDHPDHLVVKVVGDLDITALIAAVDEARAQLP
jgi:hypothetical protein